MKAQRRKKSRTYYRKGASLAMVLVSITILTIMGTLFTAIAMRSYEYSYAKLCKQQAYYTARSGINAFYSMVKGEAGLLDTLTKELDAACFAEAQASSAGDDFDFTSVRLEVGSTGGGTSEGLFSGGFFDTFLGDCDLYVRYANKERSQISIEAHASYNGYAESARAIIARTNKASSELKKIFDNTFCLQSPITTIVTDGINGDVYVSQPAPYLYDEDGNWIEEGVKGVYNKVLESLKKTSSYGTYTDVIAGQYIRDDNGNVVTDESTDVGKYNNVLREVVYANVQASTEDADMIGHTKPLSMENTPITDRNSGGETYYNDWVELYMFSAVQGDTTVDGNLYAHSRILLGLVDRDSSGRQYISYWDESLKREVHPTRANDRYWVTSNLFPEYGLEGDSKGSVKDYEHGFDVDVFFDHTRTEAVLDVSVSKFRINGNMYFWDDVRIENMDSTQTVNALNGVKNNIYAKQNLYIDGLYIDGWTNLTEWGKKHTSKQVSVYGDVFVGENAFIRGANIYGDIYCCGEELTLVDTNIYGNIYFAGSKFTADRVTVTSGSLSVNCNGVSATQNLSGGNVVIAGTKGSSNYSTYNSAAGFGTTDDTGNNAASKWGATLMDCNVYGNLWSDVNTHIVSAKCYATMGVSTPAPQTGYSEYGNIYVTKYLYIDLIMPRSDETFLIPTQHPFIENWIDGVNVDYAYATESNRITVNGMIYAERFQMKTNQSKVRDVAESYLNTVCVGRGGLYIDGCEESRGSPPQKWNISISNGLYSLSSGACYNTRINGSLVDTKNFSANASESDIINRLDSSRYSIDDALESVHYSVLNLMNTSVSKLEQQYQTAFEATDVWKDKVITLYSWSAPVQYDESDPDANNPEKTIDYARIVEGKNERGFANIQEYINYIENPATLGAAGSVSGSSVTGDYTLTITQSVWFEGHADFSQFDRVIIDTTKGNIHIKFSGGATFGDPTATSFETGSDVILKGGNLTFWYLYEPEGYEIDSPTLSVNPYTQLGLIQQGTGATYSFDGLYIISNDDCLIQFDNDVSLNGFVYAPYSHLLLKPGSSGTLNTLNGCMAIESLILTSDGDTLGFWDNLLAGITWTPEKIIDEVVEQYENSHYDYVMPPLIMDSTFQYGDAVAELDDFNTVVWEFMGYY